MARLFPQAIDDIATFSGLDRGFIIDMYNCLFDGLHGTPDVNQLAHGILKRDWSTRGNRSFRCVLEELCEKSGYEYDYLFNVLVDTVYFPGCDVPLERFVAITMEHDW